MHQAEYIVRIVALIAGFICDVPRSSFVQQRASNQEDRLLWHWYRLRTASKVMLVLAGVLRKALCSYQTLVSRFLSIPALALDWGYITQARAL